MQPVKRNAGARPLSFYVDMGYCRNFEAACYLACLTLEPQDVRLIAVTSNGKKIMMFIIVIPCFVTLLSRKV